MPKECTNVDNVTVSIDHNIAVVPVLDLKNIASYRICRHRLNEVQASFLEQNAIFASVLRSEKTNQIVYFCPAHLIA